MKTMTDLNQTIINNESDEENSEDSLKIVIESPVSKKKQNLDDSEKEIIKTVEKDLEETLDEKAAKVNLTAKHVKNILKHVVTNEHVLALVCQNEKLEGGVVYEPKLTRAKAKELLSTVQLPTRTWSGTKGTSEVQVLINEELPEDSSDDEYVPGDESEDDRDSSVVSDSDHLSIPPFTPPTPQQIDNSSQTNWTEDGLFKIPKSVSKEEESKAEEEANIALRTRSKLSLNETPLEVIEEAFIPPDITTDMYDMDCDDDDWKDFLKKFTRPLDEVVKGEDEDHDPEYNILADEENNDRDDLREELRVDKAVKVTRKELNGLMAELFEFADFYSREPQQNDTSLNDLSVISELESMNSINNTINQSVNVTENIEVEGDQKREEKEGLIEEVYILPEQIILLEQQLSQHVQMLTQNFLLCYDHPEYHEFSLQMKEYLINFKMLTEGKKRSIFFTSNLLGALGIVKYWEELFKENSESVQSYKSHVNNEMTKCINKHRFRQRHWPELHSLILETVSKSEVFLYPSLLPQIPFKPAKVFTAKVAEFTDAEDQLIAEGLEQFIPTVKENKSFLKSGEVKLTAVAEYLQENVLPTKSYRQLYERIRSLKQPRCASNPIKYFFQHGKAPHVVHYLYPLDKIGALPPCKRPLDELPEPWRKYLTKQQKPDEPASCELKLSSQNLSVGSIQYIPVVNIIQPSLFNSTLLSDSTILPKAPLCASTPNVKRKKRVPLKKENKSREVSYKSVRTLLPIHKITIIFKRKISIRKLVRNNRFEDFSEKDSFVINMLPSMPSLGTPLKNGIESRDVPQKDNENDEETMVKKSFSDIVREAVSSEDIKLIENCKTELSNESEKDNPEDINALMIASSTVKSAKKEPSGAEKKRTKIRREFLANISITKCEDPKVENQKGEMFALAYYDKMREVLELNDYHKVMQILNDFEEGDAVDLYKDLMEVLKPKYEELAEEFLLFLRDTEAAAVGQLIPWLQVNSRSKFLRKLEIYFKDQPYQLKRIYKALTELTQQSNLTMEKIKGTMLPLLKNNAVLTDLFLQSYLTETPPPSLLEGSYETIDIAKEMAKTEDDSFETIVVPDCEDKYGGQNCICSCHKIEDPEFKSRFRHCIPCGTKFNQGKVYIQSGRGLRPATVSFLTNPEKDHVLRLTGKPSCLQRRKRSDSSPSKQVHISPNKDHADDETEEDDDKKKRKSKKIQVRKTNAEKKTPLKAAKKSSKAAPKDKSPAKKKAYKKKSRIKDTEQSSSDCIDTKEKSEIGENSEASGPSGDLKAPEIMDWESNAKASPGIQTAESESEFCEESSQDNCESDSSSCSSHSFLHSQSDNAEELCWKREEDKVILETFQKENDKEHAFNLIATRLSNRTVSQIRHRFQTLMTLLLEQIGSH